MIPQVGFLLRYEVSNSLSIAHLFPAKQRAGIYCLQFANDQYYVGRAVDFVRRFTQHRKTYNDIVAVSFFTAPVRLQPEIERTTIRQVEALGYRLRNKEETSATYANSDFDELISPILQQDWLVGTEHFPSSYRLAGRQVESQRIRFAHNFARLRARADFRQLTEVLQLYVQRTLPFPRETEMIFWSLSCTPSTNQRHAPRLFVVNISTMECLVFGHEPRGAYARWGFVITSEATLKQQFGSIDEFRRIYHFVTNVESAPHSAGGHDQVLVRFESIAGLRLLLEDDRFCQSLKEFNLRLMRKRAAFFARYHCFDLADCVL